MKKIIFYFSLFVGVSLGLTLDLVGQDEMISEPWDRETVREDSNLAGLRKIFFAEKLLDWYQKKVSTQSISRCPFAISCSDYTRRAIRKHGLIIGTAYFIDRNFYRENVESYRWYPLLEFQGGILKLDDAYYLYGE